MQPSCGLAGREIGHPVAVQAAAHFGIPCRWGLELSLSGQVHSGALKILVQKSGSVSGAFQLGLPALCVLFVS